MSHVKVVAFLFLALGLLLTAGAFFSSLLFGILAAAVGNSGDDGGRVGATLLGLTGVTLTVLAFTMAGAMLVCGWGLLKTRRWARMLAIILAAVCLVEFPAGTVFGVYTLWVMFNKKTETLFAGGPGNS